MISDQLYFATRAGKSRRQIEIGVSSLIPSYTVLITFRHIIMYTVEPLLTHTPRWMARAMGYGGLWVMRGMG